MATPLLNQSMGLDRRPVALGGGAAVAVAVAIATATAIGCRRPRSPEEQVKETIAAIAHAVEDKNTRALRDLVSDRYTDGEEHDRAELLATLQLYFRRHPRIHLLTRTTAVDVTTPGTARATVVAAMASTPIKVFEDLSRVQADIHRFDLTFAEQSPRHWQVTVASWQPARPED